jgi:hypothetical protein
MSTNDEIREHRPPKRRNPLEVLTAENPLQLIEERLRHLSIQEQRAFWDYKNRLTEIQRERDSLISDMRTVLHRDAT